MSDYYFNDYDNFVGKHITVIYDCGSKCKKLHCKLLKYYEKDSKEKYIILKTRNKIIYYMNCNKIIYWIANYKDMLAENQDAYMSTTETMETNAIAEGENLFLKETQNKEIIPLMTNEDATHVELQNNDVILSDSKNEIDIPVDTNSNVPIISEEHDSNHIIKDVKFNDDKITAEYNSKDIYKKNVLRYPLAAFINCNFQGVYLTIYTTSAQAISGEVIFNYDCLIVLKSDEKTYYINPEQITYFC
ncbi:hypothetical protein [Clostridium autoethanogenum]|uniref:Uncharacterized protein n=1 Tax=Clostridium autoethanogenum DSM 10061 TaxID=1341692 RepID=A0ABM5NZX3_9CLOT|nr:hypothetical protein [Clostridium autoethanogenum]AGY78192.1 hypothetical protein CAETHG_3991 [Clostridium autoethanogenum DSM 10061]ALU38324.1 Hypothetical protein CLAU_3897 [Clostridium autoethanogenum DSM 10061]OVY51087.1 hypothetical protein WX72_02249 [Clostridium autoethanogenum]